MSAPPYKLASRAFCPHGTVIQLGRVRIGGDEVVLMAGPCSIEGEAMIHQIAAMVAEQGGTVLRGGAFKPRTSPYSFQGLGERGLKYLRDAADEHGLLAVTEVMEIGQLELVAKYADILQIGARNMQNYPLLREAGRADVPVLLKRGLCATIEEFLLAAEYIMAEGNRRVMLCERGIRTFADHSRFTLDIAAIPVLKERTHLPVLVDPSHCMGVRDKVLPMALAAIAAGADGLIVETHPKPEQALSDGPQALLPQQLAQLSERLEQVAVAVGRTFTKSPVEVTSP